MSVLSEFRHRPRADNSVRRGSLCPDSHQVHQSDGGLHWAGGENHQLSDGGAESGLSEQEISSQGGGQLSLCPTNSRILLPSRGLAPTKRLTGLLKVPKFS